MPWSSEAITERCIDLASRHWKALGVALAGEGIQGNTVVDPEALILFTAALEDADPRVRDESMDWCVRYGDRLISASRLRNLRARFPDEVSTSIDGYFATVNDHSSTRWPIGDAKPWDFEPSHKSNLPRLCKSPALLRLQLRCLFGVSARAEIVLALSNPQTESHYRSASELAFTGYSKRNIALILEDLVLSEIVSTKKVANRIGYRLEALSHLRKLAPGIRSAEHMRWDLAFASLTAARAMALEVEAKKPVVRSARARRFASEYKNDFAALGLTVPDVDDPEGYFEHLLHWVEHELAS